MCLQSQSCNRVGTFLTFNTPPDEVSLVSETSAALRALVGLLLRRRRDVSWVVVKVLVSF